MCCQPKNGYKSLLSSQFDLVSYNWQAVSIVTNVNFDTFALSYFTLINLISVWYLTALIATKLSGSYVPSTEKRLQVILFAAIWPRFVLIQFILAWPTLFAERKIWTDINTYSFKMILNLSTAIFHWKYVHLVH